MYSQLLINFSLILGYIAIIIMTIALSLIFSNTVVKLKNNSSKIILKHSHIKQQLFNCYNISGYDTKNQCQTTIEIKGFPLIVREKDGSKTVVVYRSKQNTYFG